METIYFNLVKQGLIDFVQAIHDRAVESDAGIISGLARNTKLSATKKEILNELITKLHDLTHKGKDIELKASLEKLMLFYHEKLQSICMLDFDKHEGVTEKAILSTFGLITEQWLFLEEMELKDKNMAKVKGESPVDVLAYFCTRYKLEHMIQRAMTQHRFSESFSGYPKLSKQKEDLFVQEFFSCREIINGLKQDHSYEVLVRKKVLHTIGAMRSRLTSLCRNAATGTKAGIVSFNLFGSVNVKSNYTPSEGVMKKYLIAAKTMIENRLSIKEALDVKNVVSKNKSLV